jgi:hypothetical protein
VIRGCEDQQCEVRACVDAQQPRRIALPQREDPAVLMVAVWLRVTGRRRRVDGEPVSGRLDAEGRFVLRSLWHRIADHLSEEARDRVCSGNHIDCGEQFADEA